MGCNCPYGSQTISTSNFTPSAPVLANSSRQAVERGGYIISDTATPEGILLAAGSEVQLALRVKQQLQGKGFNIRVVSMPCIEIFKHQPLMYQEKVLPPAITTRLAIEMATLSIWSQFVGLTGKVMGIERFGKSGSGAAVVADFGFTVANIVKNFINI